MSAALPVVRGPASRWLATPWAWLLLAAVVVAALAVGSVHSAPTTRADRIAYLEGIIKCPVCEDVSIAGSNAQQAVNLRAEVTRLVDAGRTDTQVEAYVVGQFGSDELLRPTNPLIWILPIVLGGVAVVGVGTVLFRRRSHDGTLGVAGEDEELVAAAMGEHAAPPAQSHAAPPAQDRAAPAGWAG